MEVTSVHGIRDPIGFVGAIVNEHREKGAVLTREQWEDLAGYLIVKFVELSKRYDVARSPKRQSFSTFAGRILRRRIVCWYRQEFGDSRYRAALPLLVSVDDEETPVSLADDTDWTVESEFRIAIAA